MKLLMEPGSALLVMAAVAFLATFVLGGLPLIGGLLTVILWFAVIFGVIGGLFLLITGRKRTA
jgi:membrane associated rhomboid family serine protease